ncbi:MAG: hypothetical protein K0U98_19660 [Deltaproteobacteria bacterium]|nr:hypothetical protein [Deltaproteobacteria bacterium]
MLRWKNWLALGIVAALGGFSGGAGSPALAQCLELGGVDYCPLGSASLSASEAGLTVTGFGGDGTSGVASSFAEGNSWNVGLDIESSGDPQEQMSFTFLSDGETISQATLTRDEDAYGVNVHYTGDAATSTYSILVYSGGVFQGGSGGNSSLGGGVEPQLSRNRQWDDISFPDPFLSTHHLHFLLNLLRRLGLLEESDFSIRSNGGCELGLHFATPVPMRLANGQVLTGDSVRFVEEVSGDGHYPYLSFDSVHIQGTMETMTISGETVEGAW